MPELKGANMDIDLLPNPQVDWDMDQCPWNKEENTNTHKCAVKHTSICKHFQGIKKPDIVICAYKNDQTP
ncbi:hypothetical protein ACFL0V_00055 [Nanoarchaeota archaeon]